MGVSGTDDHEAKRPAERPTFVIAGEKVKNQPWDDMKKIIDAKLAEAEKNG